LAFEPKDEYGKIARSAVIQTKQVETKTIIVQFRVRNVIKEASRSKQLIAEEMYLWGYTGSDKKILSYDECKDLLKSVESSRNIPLDRQKQLFNEVSESYDSLRTEIQELSETRAKHLVDAHGRFKELVGGRRYEAVYPVLPPDVMGIYVILPEPKPLY